MRVELLSITPEAEELIERAGRTCYQSSGGAGSAGPFIRKLIKMGHTSVLEHGVATFLLQGVSRSLTHQLVRHRLCSFSQQSQRYVSEAGFEAVVPLTIEAHPEAAQVFQRAMEAARRAYEELRALRVAKEDARFVLPNATMSEIVMTANFREWRHIFDLRCHRSAQWEIRAACLAMLRLLKERVPALFEDFIIDEQAGSALRGEG